MENTDIKVLSKELNITMSSDSFYSPSLNYL